MIRGVRVFFAALVLMLSAQVAWAQDVYVDGYYRDNGTYVQPHYRSAPDNSYNNNWSVSPNVNPYTGQQGTRAPTWNDQAPDSGFGSSGSNLFGGSNCAYSALC